MAPSKLAIPLLVVPMLAAACGGGHGTPATSPASGGTTEGGASASSTAPASKESASGGSAAGAGGAAPAQDGCPAGQARSETGCMSALALSSARACSAYTFSDDPHPGEAHQRQENACAAISGVLPEATAYLEARCKADDAGACHALGIVNDRLVFWYVEGLSLPPCSGAADCWSFLVAEWDQAIQGGTQDLARAVEAYDRACTLGRADACEDVARLSAEKDAPKAATYYAKACAMGRAGACAFSINAEMKKSLPDPALFVKSLAAFKKACDDGSASGCNDAGVLLATGRGAPKDLAGAVQLLDKGCSMQGPSACGNLIYVFLRNGAVAGTSPDFARAQPVLQGACDGGDARACHALGWMLDKGVGVTADHAKGKALIQKACSEGASCPK